MATQQPHPLRRVYGVVLDHFLKIRGMKPGELASAIHCTTAYVHMIRGGRRLPEPKVAELFDQALDAGGLLISLEKVIDEELRRGKQGRAGSGTEVSEADMQRRIMLQQAVTALVAAGAVGTEASLEVIRSGLASSISRGEPSERSIEDWDQTVWDYTHGMWTTLPRTQVANLAADLAELQVQLDRASDAALERDLYRVSALLAALTAIGVTDLGQPRTARQWWAVARQGADASGDPATRVMVRAQEADYIEFDHRPLQVAVERADEVQAIGGVHAGTAMALFAKAKALALMGRAPEAIQTVEALGKVFERLPTAVHADQSDFGFPEHRLRVAESNVHSLVGSFADADRAQQRALQIYPAAPRKRAYLQLYQARSRIRAGHIDDGANHAQEVIAALPQRHRIAPLLAVGHHVLDAVPATEQRRPSVTGLRDLLALSATPTT